jgi:hypothetical protein
VTGKERRPRVAPAALLPAVVVLGLLLLVWAATTGPVEMLSDSGRRYVFEPPTPPAVIPSDGSTPAKSLPELTKDVKPIVDLSWLGDVIAVAVLLGLCVALSLGLRWFWVHRWHPPEAPEKVDFEVLPEQIVDALRRDRSAQQDAVAQGSPRNGIVACWLRLEETLAEAGVPPDRAETSAEFVVRVLHTLDLDPRPVATLAQLFREARFSDHPVDESARTRARAALEDLHAELAVRGSVR